MSESAFAAPIRPKSYASSTTAVKKSVVATTARSPSIRTTAASSPVPSPTSRSALVQGVRPATTSSSSPGGILHAQPPPCAYWVRRTVALVVMAALYEGNRRGSGGGGVQDEVVLVAALHRVERTCAGDEDEPEADVLCVHRRRQPRRLGVAAPPGDDEGARPATAADAHVRAHGDVPQRGERTEALPRRVDVAGEHDGAGPRCDSGAAGPPAHLVDVLRDVQRTPGHGGADHACGHPGQHHL